MKLFFSATENTGWPTEKYPPSFSLMFGIWKKFYNRSNFLLRRTQFREIPNYSFNSLTRGVTTLQFERGLSKTSCERAYNYFFRIPLLEFTSIVDEKNDSSTWNITLDFE